MIAIGDKQAISTSGFIIHHPPLRKVGKVPQTNVPF